MQLLRIQGGGRTDNIISCSYEKLGCYIICITKTESPRCMATIYTSADIFVNPTHEDNYPTVNLEAQACGTPVITYDIGGCRETILRKEN